MDWGQFKRNPINFRKIVGVAKEYNSKGIGLFITGYCNLYNQDPKQEYLEYIISLSNKFPIGFTLNPLVELLVDYSYQYKL